MQFVFGTQGFVRITRNCYDSIGSGHFELHVPVMGYSLEARESVPSKDGVVPTVKGDHMKEQFFGSVVFTCAEYHVQPNFPRASCFSTGDNTSKGGIGLLDA